MSSSSSAKKLNHSRAPAKSTPFSAAAGVGGGDAGQQTTRSRQQRSAMTTSLRKARRGRTVARKRHMKLDAGSSQTFTPMAGCSGPHNMAQARRPENPYSRDATHVGETIEAAKSIVHVCSRGGIGPPSPHTNGESSPSSLSSLLDRFCVLLTPDDAEKSTGSSNIFGASVAERDGPSPAVGASYDSSMAGMAANSILSQFAEENPTQPQQQQYSEANNLAFLLADALTLILNTTTADAAAVRIKAVIALNQLAATEPPPPLASAFDQDQFSPYGHPRSASPSAMIASAPTSWCYVLVHSRALSALVQRLPSQSSHAASDVELYEKCVWVVGNLAGDSEMARTALREMMAVPRLIGCLSWGIAVQRDNTKRSTVDLIRNSVWSLTNLFRDGGTPAAMFLDMPCLQFTIDDRQVPRLSSRDVAMLLSAPDKFPPAVTNSMCTTKAAWNDVAVEMCWLVAFLTTDPTAVDFLCGEDGGNEVVSTLVSRLDQVTAAASRQLHATSNASVQDMGCWPLPCCRALKNMAIARDGRYVPAILLAETYNEAGCDARPTEISLARLISFGTLGGGSEASAIASEAATTAGALLYDAGLPSLHPATLACRTLLPALCRALVYPLAPFEFRREVARALWNAVEFPPRLPGDHANDAAANAQEVQKEVLAQAFLTSPNEIARALTTMLSSPDLDALEASVRLIDHLLRRLNGTIQLSRSMPIIFEEVGLVDALWRICDKDSDESATAEMAASILDDFYEQEEEDEVDESMEPASSGGQFQFRAPSTECIPEGGFNFGAAAPLQEHRAPPSMGRGRGRGQVVPAWMQRQQLIFYANLVQFHAQLMHNPDRAFLSQCDVVVDPHLQPHFQSLTFSPGERAII